MEKTSSILNSTKLMLGLEPDYEAFDVEVMTHINSTFSTLEQLGIGPEGGFSISGAEDTWVDYLPQNDKRLNNVRTYVYLRVRLLFDPPQTSHAVEAIKEQIKEIEWRINLTHEVSTSLIPPY